MVKQKFSINIFDFTVILAVAIVACIVLTAFYNKPFLGSGIVSVEVKVFDKSTIDAVLPILKTEEEVYYSGTKYPVEQTSYRIEQNASGQVEYLYITIQGPGDISDGKSIFNGQRIYANQKVEIRSDYYVQGYVVDFDYAN